MEIRITKGRDGDSIAILYADGSETRTRFPRKGPIPHDAVHYFVEHGLGFRNGFWGTVAKGRKPEEIAAMAKTGGHASASRAQIPDVEIVELLQAERLVECFEADLWSGSSGSQDGLLAMAEAGCAASHVPLPAIDIDAVRRVQQTLAAFASDWIVAPIGHVAIFRWD